MRRHLKLVMIFTIIYLICSRCGIVIAANLPVLYSPSNGSYVDGLEIDFSWAPVNGCMMLQYGVNICSDSNCNDIIYQSDPIYSTSFNEYFNYNNNGIKYYWFLFTGCIDYDYYAHIYNSNINSFTTYDEASSATLIASPTNSVIEGSHVNLTAYAYEAPLNDYLYRFYVDTYIDGHYSSTRTLQSPSNDSTYTWTAPAYNSNNTYVLGVEVGTSSYESYHGSFYPNIRKYTSFYNVLPSSRPVINPTTLPYATYNKPYDSGPMGVTGGQGPYTWEIYVPIGDSDNLPSGLSVDSNTGAITGTPNVWNQDGLGYLFYIQVTDARGLTASAPLTLFVYSSLNISPSYLVDTLKGTYYNQTLAVSGGKSPYSDWEISYGSLPTGLSLDPKSGAITGYSNSVGHFPFTVKISDSLGTSTENPYNIFVYPPMSIITPSLPDGMAGRSYSAQPLAATGGYTGAYCWSLVTGSSLPAGLTLSPAGVISGTPQTVGRNNTFTVHVGDACQNPKTTDNRTFTIDIYSALSINPITLPSGSMDSYYDQTFSATGGNEAYTWAIAQGPLPPGLTLSSAGEIHGTPTDGGTYRFTVQVSDSQSPTPATASVPFVIDVAYKPLQITTTLLPSGTEGTLYNPNNLTLNAAGGKTPYSWSVSSGSLPAGLTLNPSNGLISGTPADVGYFSFTVQVTDSQGTPANAWQSYSFDIANGIMQICMDNPTIVKSGASPKICTNSSTNIMTGVVAHDQELFSTKGGAFGGSIELFYNSLPSYNGPLGIGWSHTYDIFLVENSDGSIVLQSGGSKSFYTKSGSSYISPPGDYSTLVKNADGTYIISYRDGLKNNFRTDGKIVSVIDRFNNMLSFGYTGSDLTSITDQAQRTTAIGYDQTTAPHRISTITDPNGKVYDFSYQGNTLYQVKNPAADPAVNPDRGYWEYQYYPDNFLKSKRDPNNNTSQYTYYTDHRMWTATDPEGQTRTTVYPTTTVNLRTTTFTEKDNGQWLYTYDVQNGVIKQKTDPNGKLTKYSYYANGNIKSATEPKDGAVSLTTFYTYDSYGHLLTQTEPVDLSAYSIDPETVTDPATLASLSPPIKPAIRYSYDTTNFDQITSVSDERVTPFLTTTYVYTTENSGDVITGTTTPGNYVTVIKKYPNGAIKEVIDANGKSTTFSYYPDSTDNRTAGSVGLLWTVTDPAGIVTTITGYDKNGNPLGMTVKDTSGTVRLTSTQQHDALNQLKQLTKTAALLPNIVTKYGHDNLGNQSSLIDAEGRETKYEYNYNRRVKKITDAKLNDTVFKYSGSEGNGVDKLVGVFDANVTKNGTLDSQPHTAFTYDKLGRLEYETDQLGKKMYYTYYDNGQLKEKYDATNSTPGTLLATYQYNIRGQITDKTFTDGTSEHFTYYLDGKLWTATNQNISYTYNYYNDGRLQNVTDTTNGRVISYDQYDNLGQRKQVTILKGAGTDERVISYDYDTANRPWHITSSAGAFTYAYDNLGRRDTLSYPNTTTTKWDFDDLNRLTAITHKVTGGAPFAVFGYPEYYMVGNRKSASGNKNESYLYDELYRLLSVTSGKPEAFHYDAVGNRQDGPSPADTVYAHNNANQTTQGRRLGYDYDDFGNQTTKTVPGGTDKSWVQTWDYQNRLVKVEKTKGTEKRTVTFSYDPLGRRISKQMTIVKDEVSQTQSWNYVYDGDSIAVEIYTDENNTTTKTYYTQGPGIDEHLALERSGQFYYYHADGLGSIANITDAAHAVVQSYEFDSYGMVTPANEFRNSYTYTGREWDKEAGIYYYRARYYDPMEGKFISKDPIGYSGGDTNLYGFVEGNPANLADPMGLFSIKVYEFGYKDQMLPFKAIIVAESNSGKTITVDGSSWPDAYSNKPGIQPGVYEAVYSETGHQGTKPGIRLRDGAPISTLGPNPGQNGKDFATGVNLHCGATRTRGSTNCITVKKTGTQCRDFFGIFEEGETGTVEIIRQSLDYLLLFN